MGALHEGHISLIRRSKKENDFTVSSIFVNPLQFNDKKDLEKYPRTLESDTEKLIRAGCDVLFAPPADEMYPSSPIPNDEDIPDLGLLDKVMEGTHRPGHFYGVCVVVRKLFEIVEPDKAYFGEKDFQQLAIIRYMVKQTGIPVDIIPCPTIREHDGLAMSSRNVRLNEEERRSAPTIYRTMTDALKLKEKGRSPSDIIRWVYEQIDTQPALRTEYFEIVDRHTLQAVNAFHNNLQELQACIAVKAGEVRLIDNIPF